MLVEFLDGDIDRPIVIGQLRNCQQALPWPAGVDSGANCLIKVPRSNERKFTSMMAMDDHKPSLPKQFQASWTFWTEHYAALTGRQDVLASVRPGDVA